MMFVIFNRLQIDEEYIYIIYYVTRFINFRDELYVQTTYILNLSDETQLRFINDSYRSLVEKLVKKMKKWEKRKKKRDK